MWKEKLKLLAAHGIAHSGHLSLQRWELCIDDLCVIEHFSSFKLSIDTIDP